MHDIKSHYFLFALILIVIFSYTGPVRADEVAKVFSAQGQVEVQLSTGSSWQAVTTGASLESGSSIRTLHNSRAGLVSTDGIVYRLNENSLLTLQSNGSAQRLGLNQGELYGFSRKPNHYPDIDTPSVSAAVRGTEFVVSASNISTQIDILDGRVIAQNKLGSIEGGPGERLKTNKGQAPTKAILLNPLDSVQWAVYFPPVLVKDKANLTSNVSQAAELLSVGQINAAQELLNKPTKDLQASSTRSALQAIIALVQNDKDKAIELAVSATKSNPSSESAWIALSYAQQSKLDLVSARLSAQNALKASNNSPLSLERLSEIELALGETEHANTLAEQALAADPSSARALTTLGFIKLVQYEPELAKSLFERSIAQDDSSGLSYLGLGLTVIRTGDLENGRRYLEKSVALDPTTSIYRSYLGKAYFEEEKEDMAENEYGHAIRLDPNDPTPYLYRAYNRVSKNRPVAALEDVEDSITRNDNRAVYRSSLLLDQDQAVRSAGLAEVFNVLGFQKVARVEAIKALNKDFGNYSAHRFLADSYSTIDLADSKFSEQNITGLLSPLSFNLFNAASSTSGVNEYSSMFERPEHRTGINFQGSTNDDTFIPEIFEAGRTQKFGYLVGFQSANSGGTHSRNFSQDNRARMSLQYQLTAHDRLIVGGTYQNLDSADDQASFYSSTFERVDLNLGYQHQIDNSSQIIAQITHQNGRDRLRGFGDRPALVSVIENEMAIDLPDQLTLDELSVEKVKDLRTSLQYHKDAELYSVIIGGENYYVHPKRTELSSILLDELEVFEPGTESVSSLGTNSLNSQGVYVYPTFHLTKWLDLNAGMNYSHLALERREVLPFSSEDRTDQAWSPKLGLTSYLSESLTARVAYFENLRKSALESAGSLEPTLVGGINQIFSDFSGTRSRNLGAGLDYKLAKSSYFGVEYVRRNYIETANDALNLFEFNLDQGTDIRQTELSDDFEAHFDRDIVAGYFYQILSDRFASTLDYGFDQTESTDPNFYQNMKLHKAVAALRYFDPSGFFSSLSGTWRAQDRIGAFFADDGSNDFWLFDASVGYRFPRRHGTLALKFENIFDQSYVYDQSLGIEEFLPEGFSARLLFSLNF